MIGSQQISSLLFNSFCYFLYSQSLGSQVMVVSSQTPSSPEIRPVSPMSPLLQSGIQPRLRSPFNRSTPSPDSGKQSLLVQRDFIAGMQSPMVQTDFNAANQSPMVQKDSKAINQSPTIQKDLIAVNQFPLVKNGFIAAYKDDQNFFTTGNGCHICVLCFSVQCVYVCLFVCFVSVVSATFLVWAMSKFCVLFCFIAQYKFRNIRFSAARTFI